MLKRFAIATALVAAALFPAAARADDTVNLAIPQKGAWDTMVAQQCVDSGICKRAKLEIKQTYTSGGSDTVQAVVGGGVDIGIGVGTTAAIAAYSKGAPVKIVAAQMTGAPDQYFYVKAESPINSFKDLNGKSIGFTRPGSSSYVCEHVLAEQEGVKPNFVATGEMAPTLTQVMSGQIDAGWAVAPINFDLIKAKKIKIIGRGSDAKALSGQTVRVSLANATWLNSHRDVAQRFWKAYADTIDWMYKNQSQSLANYARYNNFSLDDAKPVLQYYPQSAMQVAKIADFDKSIGDAVEFKFIPQPLTADQKTAAIDLFAFR